MPKQARDDGVAAGLRQQALARVDQQDGELRIGGAGRHVAGVLLVAGRVGDDEGALLGREIAVGDIDGTARERGQVILDDQVLLMEQAADQRRFAVVDRAAGEKPQRRPRIGGNRARGRRAGDLHRRAQSEIALAQRSGAPEDFAGIAVFLAAPASDFITGTAIPVDGGYSVQT